MRHNWSSHSEKQCRRRNGPLSSPSLQYKRGMSLGVGMVCCPPENQVISWEECSLCAKSSGVCCWWPSFGNWRPDWFSRGFAAKKELHGNPFVLRYFIPSDNLNHNSLSVTLVLPRGKKSQLSTSRKDLFTWRVLTWNSQPTPINSVTFWAQFS